MHWLQALDTSLFRFRQPVVGQSVLRLAHAGFERQRLFLSRRCSCSASACFGKAMPACDFACLLLVLILPLGDGLVTQHHQTRRRPAAPVRHAAGGAAVRQLGKGYVPPEINESGVEMSTGKGSRTSMPSSHAGNWFAATMILFIYYRRSLWFMLPLALAVSFSRVYNGVHYPSDVLAGAILGAGYAAAGAIALQAAWRWIGKKWFPVWHAQLPSLLNPVRSPKSEVQSQEPPTEIKSEIGNRKSEIEWLRLGYIVIFVMLIGRWIYLASGTIESGKGRSLSMALVKTPRAVVLQQAAGHRADSIRRHLAVRRHGIWRPVFFAVVRRDFERDGAALLRPRSQRAGGVLAVAHRHRHAAARHRHDFDDD